MLSIPFPALAPVLLVAFGFKLLLTSREGVFVFPFVEEIPPNPGSNDVDNLVDLPVFVGLLF